MNSEADVRIRPARGDHAIEAVALGIEWSPALSGDAIASAMGAHADPVVASLLPTRRSVPSFLFHVGDSVQSHPPEIQELVDFIHELPDGTPDLVVSLRPEFFSCTSTLYKGWKSTKTRLLTPLTEFVKRTHSEGFQAVGLQYFDVFRWNKTDGNLAFEVLRDDSPWLPLGARHHSSLWHIHQGWFSEDTTSRRILNSINIDLQDINGEFVLQIHGQHKLQGISFKESSAMPLQVSDIEAAAETLHAANKSVLNRLLTSKMLRRIGMKIEAEK